MPLPPSVPRRAPLSFGQERLWFLDQLEPGSAVYNEAVALRLRGSLHEGALAGSLAEMMRRHEILRTAYLAAGGEPAQEVAPELPVPLVRVDLEGLADAEPEGRRLLAEENGRPFDLARAPLFRALLVRLGECEHLLLITIHHSIYDAATFEILLRELSALYGALAAGRSPALPEPSAQYRDYAVWQRQRQESERAAEQLAGWRRRLEGLEDLALLADRPRPARPSYQGGRLYFSLPEAPLESLGEVGRRQGASPFMVLLAAFFELLYRYTGQRDLAVGTTVSLRNRRDFESLVGFFINTLVLRVETGGDPTFRELVGQARGVTLEAVDNQEVPFERLVSELRPERNLSRQPLVQAIFMVQPALRRERRLGDLQASLLDVYNGTAKLDLLVHLYLGPGELSGGIEYSRDLFDGSTIDRLVGHFSRLLSEVGREPDRPLSTLSLLAESERHQLVEEWSGQDWRRPRRATIDGLFSDQARRSPEAVALAWDGGRLTYRELDAAATRQARALRALGVGPEVLVGICAERSPELIVALLAILRAGGAYLPLDPGHPPERLAFMLRDGGARLLLLDATAAARLPEIAGVERVELGALDSGATEEIESAEGEGHQLAYVMYTSGSTGRPKGVAVPHEAVVRLVRETGYLYFDGEVFLQLAPVSFDASTLEIWGPLLNGGRLALFPAGVPTVESLGAALRTYEVSVLWLTAGLFHLVVTEDVQALAPVRQLLAGGDVLAVPAVRRVLAELPGTRLINGYGPTENTTFTCCHTVVEPVGERVAIGAPVAGTRVHVLDGELRPVPVGIPGELFAGGRGLARGYLGRPELTAERFVPDPLGLEPGGRLYRTGDRVRFRPDGTLEFLGRFDEQVKVRGFRVEPGEIEAVLAEHPSVAQALVTVLSGGPVGERRLVAYVTGSGEGRPETSALRAFVSARLPESMVPSFFVVLDEFPLTPNGKVDRRRLPAPDPESSGEHHFLAPRTPTEELLAAAWARLFGLDRVGVHASFFDLGGHSLLAARLAGWLRETWSVELPVRALFEAPTLAALAERVDAARREGWAVAVPPITPAGRPQGGLPLSFAQERLWFLDRLQPGGSMYNIAFLLRLRGLVDAGALAASLSEIVRRHEALRTVFPADGDRVSQVVLPSPFRWPLPRIDLRGVPERTVEELAAAEARQPFDLAAGPLLRTVLLDLGAEEHALLLTMHHIIADGWSMRILLDELEALTAAGLPLPELAVQYPDFALWQRRWLTDEVLAPQLDAWRERLRGVPPLDLLFDRPRPSVETLRGATRAFTLPARLLDGLERLGRGQGTTLFMTLLAAFEVLLSRYAGGQEDFCVGSPVSSRPRPEVEPLIGLFLNTLALRADLTGGPSFLELLARVRETALDAYAHQDIPFERLVEALQPERDLSRAPIFQVMLSVQGGILEARRIGGAILTVEPLETGSSRFDLTLSLSAADGRLHGWLEFGTDLFDAATIGRLVLHFERVLEGVVAVPGSRVSEIPLLAAAERHQLLAEWNDTWTEPAEVCLHELLEAAVRRTPEAVALVDGAVALTYRELDQRADRVAGRLRSLGVGPEVRAGVHTERSAAMVVAILGVLKAGGAYLPLDPEYPLERLELMLRDAGARVLLTSERLFDASRALASRLAGEDLRVLRTDDAEEAPPPSATGFRPVPANLAYLIYTSGSTGRPKGVAITHASAVVLIRWASRVFPAADLAGMLASTSICFDMSVFELFAPLSQGGRIILADNVLSLPGLAGVTLVDTVPSAMTHLLREGSVPASVRTVNLGGEPLLPALVDQIHRLPGIERVFDLYGPTEDTTFSTFALRRPGDRATIGRAVEGTRVLLLDAELRPVPVGVVGELYLGGRGLARGYLDRPALTAESFLPDPLADMPGERLYRTRDLARWRPEGTLEYLGRTDHQVKVRGFRVELGEIEAALAGHPGVREVAVLAPRVDGLRDRLAAYVVPADGPAPATEELEAFLRQRLPDFMIPQAFMVLDAFPHTASGKIDRRSLPAPEWAAGSTAPAPPRTPVGELVAGIWCEVLGVEEIGPEDSFFTLGGHSLLAAQVASRVRRALGVELPLRDVFEAPTLADLAVRIEAMRRGGEEPPPPILRAGRTEDPPASYAQERLWFLDQVLPDGSVYNIPALFWIRGRLDPSVLAASLGAIVRRHEVLRSAIVYRDDRLVQVVAPPADPPLPVVDVADRAAALALAAREAWRPFDLACGPLLRALLLRLGPEEHALLLTMHHIVADGGSLRVLAGELAAWYPALRDGEPALVPDLPVQYGDFAVWQREWLAGEALERQLAYWRARLAGIVPLDLPADRPRPPVRTYHGATKRFVLPPAVLSGLERCGHQWGATLFMTLLAAFSALLSRYSGQEDLCIGTPVTNRVRPELEPLVGLFVNTLVLRAGLSGNPPFVALLERARESSLEAYMHQDVPFERLVAELQPVRDASRTPLFQVMLAFQDTSFRRFALADLEVETEALTGEVSRFDLTLSLAAGEEGLSAWLEYSSDLFDPATIERLVSHFGRLLGHVAAGTVDRRLGDLPLLGPAEVHQIAVEWNDSRSAFPRTSPLHDLFERQADLRPGAVAVAAGEEALSYRELDRRANQLARHLRHLRVAPGDRVGVAVERSAEAVVALLGILKAGAVYVPLDPSYPKERLAFMIGDSGVSILVTGDGGAGTFPEDAGGRPIARVFLGSSRLAAESGERLGMEGDGDQAACIFYTSGSTGRPKGVVVRQNAIARLVLGADYLQIQPGDRVAQASTLSFDAATWEIWGALLNGATLDVLPRDTVLAPMTLATALRRRGVNVMFLTTSLFQQVAAEEPAAFSHLDALLFGGEAADPGAVRRILETGPPRRILNLYGPTEGTTYTTWYEAGRIDERARTVPIGTPVANSRVLVLGRHSELVPAGVMGELCVAGDGLAWGYLGRPDLTAEKFVPNPLAGEAGERLYRTGDLGRLRPDGLLDFVGRIDHQIKVRGFRIEPGEIEVVLASHPEVKQALVLAHRGSTGGELRLVAYVAGTGTRRLESGELRAFLAARLPDHMMPAAFMILDELPLNPNGKVDRRALPAPEVERSPEGELVAPRSPLEETLAAIWSEVLGVERIGVHDDFFALGGHSLMAARVISRVRRRLGIEVPVATLFERSTLAELADAVVGEEVRQASADELSGLLEILDGLSEEEVLQRLAEPAPEAG